MIKSVVINLGNGDLEKGFPVVTAQLWAVGNALPQQFIGSLPAAPNVVGLYKQWQSMYRILCDRYQVPRSLDEDDELEIDTFGITNVSVVSFDQLCQSLEEGINRWLKSQEFLNIDQQLRSQLNTAEEIRVIIETNDLLLRRLPWHRWNFVTDYPYAEIALSQPEYKRRFASQKAEKREKVRILAILGNSQGIDLEKEISLLQRIEDAEVVFIVNPSRQEFNTQLWDSTGWDILFFAGHSQTLGETGRIYINENQINNSLTIEQLQEALLAAIDNGLRCCIFNSCDGLGLAHALEKLSIPTTIVMREPVPNRVAQDFFQYFLQGFAVERLSLYQAVQQARRKLQGLENDFPGASWLPVICQNPAVEPPTWLNLGGILPCPYRGLFAFREEDASFFFGREEFTEQMVAAVKKKPLVAVVGASGSGKSSVVFAGLIPQLRQETNLTWLCVNFRPGNNPFEALARALALNQSRQVELQLETQLRQNSTALSEIIESIIKSNRVNYPIPKSTNLGVRFAGKITSFSRPHNLDTSTTVFDTPVQIPTPSPNNRLVIIADQFEELYTLCTESERASFLDTLLHAVKFAPGFTLVMTLRADFYGYALSYRPLSDALQGAVLNLGPMSRQELRDSIEQPAAQMQIGIEHGLTKRFIDDMEHRGRLPLLEFALTSLWPKHENGLLTHRAYKEIGGVEEALANHAEAVYAQLTIADRIRAQRVFMQLVRLGEGAEATRRLATRDEVRPENWDLVTLLASKRLVVTNRNESTFEETVEIVHEALITNWGRLGLWMQVDGEFRRAQEQLRTAMQVWESSSFDEGALLRGKPLTDAEYWQEQRQEELSSGERSFLAACLEFREREILKHKRKRQVTIFSLAGGMVLTSFLCAIALWQWHNSAISEINVFRSSAEKLLGSNQEFDALIESVKAGSRIKHTFGVDAKTQIRTVEALQQAVNFVRERNRLEGHNYMVASVSFSPDGKTIATASKDKTVKLWSQEGKELQTLRGHLDGVTSVSFSPDNQIIATGSVDKTVKLWSLEGKELQTLRGHEGAVNSVDFSPDGKIIATASTDKTLKLWNREGKELQTLRGHEGAVNSVDFSPDGEIIATASLDKTVKLWSRDGKELQTLRGHQVEVNSVNFSPDSKTIATAGGDKTVKLWSREGKELQTLRRHLDGVTSVTFSPDGNIIASGSWDSIIKLWSRDGKELQTLRGHNAGVAGISFSPDSKTIATAAGDKTVKLWSRNEKQLQIFGGHYGGVKGVSFSPDGKTIATASWDKTIKIWNREGKELQMLEGHQDVVNGTTFSPDGNIIATASRDKTAKLWNLEGKQLQTLKGHENWVNSVAFSPNGKTIATASADKTVKLWNLEGKQLQTLRGHNGEVTSVSFSPDGKTVATASVDKTVKLWNLEGKLQTLHGHNNEVTSVTFSPDGKIIATASVDNTVKLWNLEGKELQTLRGHLDGINSVSFSQDGKMIATGSIDKTVKLWNLEGKELHTFRGHLNGINSVSFSPDSKMIVSGSWDKTAILWSLHLENLDELMLRSCNWLHDYFKTNRNVSESDRNLCDIGH